MVHCNNKKIAGSRWKRSCFTARYFCLNSKFQKKKTQLRFQILIACRETGSLPEEVKQKDNLCEHNIQLQLRISIDIWGLFATFFFLTLDLCLPTVHIHVLSGRAFYTPCDVINLNVNRYSR